MKIGIIGAGAAGLSALKHSIQQGHECIVFEQTTRIGGTWAYTDQIEIDDSGLPVHSSMYQGLKTNLPKEIMEYEDFPYDKKPISFVPQEDVLNYMKSFAKNFNLYPFIKFLTHVIEVIPQSNDKWQIKTKDLKSNEITIYNFDAVMVCVGNYSVPNSPTIPGSEKFQGQILHSHYFRKPEPFKGKKVLLIGAGPSGIDISGIISTVADKVYLSFGRKYFKKIADSVVQKPYVKSLESNKAIFSDGTEEIIDTIMYCTGYKYSYPFLSPECGIKVEDNWVQYLYKHIVNVEHPTMGFMGIVFTVCRFPLFDMQAKFYLEFLKNPKQISKEEMLKDVLADVEWKKEHSWPIHNVHKIGNTLHEKYANDLADTVKIKRLKPVLHKIFNHLYEHKNFEKRYEILNDEEFLVLN